MQAKHHIARRVQTEVDNQDEDYDHSKYRNILKERNIYKPRETTFSTMNMKKKEFHQFKKQNSSSQQKSSQKKSVNPDKDKLTFTNIKVIGSGTFGIVYQSRINETGEIVAIKKVLQDRKYKNRELQILQELDHPNVLKLRHHYFTTEKGESYLHVVSDFYQESLYSCIRQYVRAGKKMSELLVKVYSYQLLKSIGYLAQQGICHRDIKPHNVLVNPVTNKLILIDYGSAKKLVKGEENIAYICSRCYRAPELIFGATQYNYQIDVWSVGCVIAEMFNGEPLFLGESSVDQLVEIIKVLGTPSKEQVKEMNPKYDLSQYKFIQIKKRDWKKVLRTKNELALDLMNALMVYSPEKRLTPYDALMHPYFDDLRNENFIKTQNLQVPDLFNFEQDKLTFEQKIKLIPRWYKKTLSASFKH